MRRPILRITPLLMSLCLAWQVDAVVAQIPAPIAPVAPPPTLWSWLGVPQNPAYSASSRLGNSFNSSGNYPGAEATPRLLPITAPQNLKSQNPAIKAAAEIKMENDKAAQKIKAIKYLGTVGCGSCAEGAAEALLAALDDCTEAVRYEAVKAILKTASCQTDRCAKRRIRSLKTCHEAFEDAKAAHLNRFALFKKSLHGKAPPSGETAKSKRRGYGDDCLPPDCDRNACGCGEHGCCNSDTLNKLSSIVYERDDRGCYKEPSARVRAMALEAMRACNPNPRPAGPEEVPAGPVMEEIPAGPVDAKETAPETGKETAPDALRSPRKESLPPKEPLPTSETSREESVLERTPTTSVSSPRRSSAAMSIRNPFRDPSATVRGQLR